MWSLCVLRQMGFVFYNNMINDTRHRDAWFFRCTFWLLLVLLMCRSSSAWELCRRLQMVSHSISYRVHCRFMHIIHINNPIKSRISVCSFVQSVMTICRAHCVENVESEALINSDWSTADICYFSFRDNWCQAELHISPRAYCSVLPTVEFNCIIPKAIGRRASTVKVSYDSCNRFTNIANRHAWLTL